MSTTNVPAAGRFTSQETIGTTWLSTPLPKLLAGDVLIGTSVSFCISPFVAMVDQAIVQRSIGTHTIMSSVQATMGLMLRQPAVYFRSTPFLWMWALYAATYSTANSLKTMQEHLHGDCRATGDNRATEKANQSSVILCTSPYAPAYSTIFFENPKGSSRSGMFSVDRCVSWLSGAASTLVTSSFGLLVATGTVNISMSLLKDRAYARMFSRQQPSLNNAKPPTVPKLCYALWTVRDFMVVGSSFLLPDMVVQNFLKNGYIDHTQANTTLRNAQFLMPIASQVVAGPIHLLGLNVYERPGLKPLERLRCFQYGALVDVIGARMARILPAFSIGGVGNTFLRDLWRHRMRTA